MAVLSRNRKAFYVPVPTKAKTRAKLDNEFIGSLLCAVAALILFAGACWLIGAEPGGAQRPTHHDSGLADIGSSYAPVEHFPATGTAPIVDDSYSSTIR